jgi:hypothetical protein
MSNYRLEGGKPKPRRGFFERNTSEILLDRLSNPGNNLIGGGDSLEVFGNRMVVESRIGSNSNLQDSRRQLGDTLSESRWYEEPE